MSAKTARDFLLYFHHSQISLGEIVIEWNGEIVHKSQDLLSSGRQSVYVSNQVKLSQSGHRQLRRGDLPTDPYLSGSVPSSRIFK